MTDQKKYLATDLVERKAQFLEQNICPHCDHAEVSKQGNNVFVTDYYTGDFGTLGNQKVDPNPVFHHREELECKCHCHFRSENEEIQKAMNEQLEQDLAQDLDPATLDKFRKNREGKTYDD
jgi:hypothetical protein